MFGNLLARVARRTSRYKKSESGVAAIEFSFVVGPFLLVLCPIMETGCMMFSEYSLQAAVQQSARLMRTGQAQSNGLSAADFKTKICNIVGSMMDCSKIVVYSDSAPTFASLKSKMPSSVNIGSQAGGGAGPTSYKCGAPLEAVGVVATYDWNFVFPMMSFNANTSDTTKKRLVGIALFAAEPFPSTTACGA
jgi:Flp pilus assembly protein TadG